MRKKLFKTWQKTRNVLKTSILLIIGVLLLISLFNNIFQLDDFVALIQKNTVSDIFISASAGSLAAGSPITSYIISGELQEKGISLAVIVAFILTWVTVGIVQFPAESIMLGRKFAVVRNLLSFFSAIIIAMIMDFFLF